MSLRRIPANTILESRSLSHWLNCYFSKIIMSRHASPLQPDRVSLDTLPYDLLLHVAQYLDFRGVCALRMTCKLLCETASTRPVFRNLAVDLLHRCRALPLSGFQRLSDLNTEQLIRCVLKANRLEQSWFSGMPQPSPRFSYGSSRIASENGAMSNWYKVIRAPPGEEVDWLSPITTRYSLCATKSGKVVCWDVDRDASLAEWSPEGRWVLWKCRVEFDRRTVFFTMAQVIRGLQDEKLMEFVVMKLEFPETADSTEHDAASLRPSFTQLASFKTMGVVMNIFLLDPASRLLSAFVWIPTAETIGLYVLLDWDKDECVFINTGIDCAPASNWTCILSGRQVVIHCEDGESLHQYFYPISLLQKYARPTATTGSPFPVMAIRIDPVLCLSAPFIFPGASDPNSDGDSDGNSMPGSYRSGPVGTDYDVTNPFPDPRWYPESAHFVRQWWPTIPSAPRLSCAVILLADTEVERTPVGRTRYVLTQHYFKVPLVDSLPTEAIQPQVKGKEVTLDLARIPEDTRGLLRLWYVSEPFEVACIMDDMEDDEEDIEGSERPRPLIAVDFGHAVWVENATESEGDRTRETKKLRFVSFPPVPGADGGVDWSHPPKAVTQNHTHGWVRTLESPPELDLSAVETLNIDQSQGAVIVSVAGGQIFILCYD